MIRAAASVALLVGLLIAGGCDPAPQDCPRCAGLAADNAALRQDNDRLRAELNAGRRTSAPPAAPATAPSGVLPPTTSAFVPPAPRMTTPTPAPSEKLAVSVQCSGTTQKGARCKRLTKSPNGRCYQHGGN